jgi:hypothetical protein
MPDSIDPPEVNLGPMDKDAWLRPVFNASGDSLVLEICSRSSSEAIAIEKRVLFRVLDHSSLPSQVNLYAPYETGGGIYYRNFLVSLDWNEDPSTRYVAEFAEGGFLEMQGEVGRPPELSEGRTPDFFTLAPGELERFIVQLQFAQPGIYDLLAGVEYSYKGEQGEIWLRSPVTVYAPGDYLVWSSFEDQTFITRDCTFRPFEIHSCENFDPLRD